MAEVTACRQDEIVGGQFYFTKIGCSYRYDFVFFNVDISNLVTHQEYASG